MLKRDLTFSPKKLSFDHHPNPIELFNDATPGWLGVPRAWGRTRYDLPIINRMTDGEALTSVTRRPDPNHPRAAPGQAVFMNSMRQALTEYDEVQAVAATGSGKTVVALDTSVWLGRKTLIMVHLERIADQWIEEIQDKLGVPREKIGKVQGPRCDWQGRDYCVAILNSAAQRAYTKEFYESFGLLIVDEAHKIGTEFFAPAIARFPARKRLTLTATETRADGGHKVVEMHAGPVRARSATEALAGDVHVIDYDCGNYKLWGTDSKSRVACLAKDYRRNTLIANTIYKAYKRGRNMLAISYAVEHVEVIMTMVHRLGVPWQAMGQYTGEKTARHENGRPRMHNGKVVRIKLKSSHFERVKRESQLIFATYAIFTEAIDIPRLDAGIDMTPRASATQVIGRIRRPMPGKKRPLWVTIRDVQCPISERMFQARRRDYLATGMQIGN